MEKIEIIKQHLEGHIHENVTVQDIAQSVYVSPVQLYRIFKKHTGLTPVQYHEQLRIKKGVQLLSKHRVVGDVSYTLGYENYETFSRAFKKLCLITPSDLLWGLDFSDTYCQNSNHLLVHESASLPQIKQLISDSGNINTDGQIEIFRMSPQKKRRPKIIHSLESASSFSSL